MTNIINHQKLEAYSRALAEKLSTDFFRKKNFASGDDILHFTPIEQVNLFIVKIVFDKWKEENERLRSAYFDYENAEVKEALGNLMVKLSKHISIRKEHFDNLLNKAIRDTLFIIADPYFFIKTEYLNKSSMQLEEIKDREKYIRINKIFLQDFIIRMERENRRSVNVIEVGDMLDKIFSDNKDKAEDIQKHLAEFSSLLLLQENELLNANVQKQQVIKPEQEIPKPKAEPPTKTKLSQERESTLNDKLRNNDSALFEKHSKSRIEDLRTAISMVQKFLFINELFKGDAAEFNKALDALNSAADYRAALDILHNNYANKYSWEPEKDEVKEFYQLVERKFNI
jgi:hypothetical protein